MPSADQTLTESRQGLLKAASILSFKCADIVKAIMAEDWKVVNGLVADISRANGHLQRAHGRFVGADLTLRRLKKDVGNAISVIESGTISETSEDSETDENEMSGVDEGDKHE